MLGHDAALFLRIAAIGPGSRRGRSSPGSAFARGLDGMRILFALPGLHRHNRGAEIAFTAIAGELARAGHEITLIGSGQPSPEAPYRFLHAASVPRERFAHFPFMPV